MQRCTADRVQHVNHAATRYLGIRCECARDIEIPRFKKKSFSLQYLVKIGFLPHKV